MGTVTFTATFSDGASKSVTTTILDPEFIKGYWTKDKAGKEPLERAVLGETVYFHVETKNLRDGKEITLKLADFDHNLWIDWIAADDWKFPEEEVVRTASVQNNKATIEVLLEESWEVVIAQDRKDDFMWERLAMELYWQISFNDRYQCILPKNTDDYLRVGFNSRTLYVREANPDFNLPELYSFDGEPIALLEFVKAKVKSEVEEYLEEKHGISNPLDIDIKEEVRKSVTKWGKTTTRKIALAKAIRDNRLEDAIPYSKNFENDYYTNDPNIVKELRNKTDWNIKDKTPIRNHSAAFYSRTGKRVQILKLIDVFDDTLNIFDVSELFTISEERHFDGWLPVEFGYLHPALEISAMLVEEVKAEQDEIFDQSVAYDLEIVKKKGLKAVERFVADFRNYDRYSYDLLAVSNKIACKLMNGEFMTIDDLEAAANKDSMKNVKILYREERSETRKKPICTIEAIFINE